MICREMRFALNPVCGGELVFSMKASATAAVFKRDDEEIEEAGGAETAAGSVQCVKNARR